MSGRASRSMLLARSGPSGGRPPPPGGPVAVAPQRGRVELALRRGGGEADLVTLAPPAARGLGAVLLDAGPPGPPVAATRLPGPVRRFAVPAGAPRVIVAVDRTSGRWVVHGVPPEGPAGPGVTLTGAQARLLGAELIASARSASAELADEVGDRAHDP